MQRLVPGPAGLYDSAAPVSPPDGSNLCVRVCTGTHLTRLLSWKYTITAQYSDIQMAAMPAGDGLPTRLTNPIMELNDLLGESPESAFWNIEFAIDAAMEDGLDEALAADPGSLAARARRDTRRAVSDAASEMYDTIRKVPLAIPAGKSIFEGRLHAQVLGVLKGAGATLPDATAKVLVSELMRAANAMAMPGRDAPASIGHCIALHTLTACVQVPHLALACYLRDATASDFREALSAFALPKRDEAEAVEEVLVKPGHFAWRARPDGGAASGAEAAELDLSEAAAEAMAAAVRWPSDVPAAEAAASAQAPIPAHEWRPPREHIFSQVLVPLCRKAPYTTWKLWIALSKVHRASLDAQKRRRAEDE